MRYVNVVPVLLLLWAEKVAPASHALRAFKSPGSEFKPKFRYWLPDASAEADWIVKDIEAIAEVGAGGLEWLPYYQLSGDRSSDWAKYGYGTDSYLQLNRAAWKAAADHDLNVDFSVGANQGQGVPSEVESPGLAMHLAYANVSIAAGNIFNGVLPLSKQPYVASLAYFMHECEEFGQQNLTFVHAVEVVSEDSGNVTIGNIVDLTSQVNRKTNSLTWGPSIASNSTWRIIAWYERYTNQRSINGGNSPTSYVQNGSWIVDHFSAVGSRKMTDFYDNFIIPEESDKKLLAEIGGFAWEDSMEAMSALWWTPGFADQFKKGRGYNLSTCIPFLIIKENYWASSRLPYGETFVPSKAYERFADKCNDDYRLTLQQGYREYLRSNVAWAHSRGVKYSCQPAYNLPLSMPNSIPLVDGPEVESLGFQNADNYRHGAGPVHLMGNPILSSEAGAVSGSVYTQTIRDLLEIVRTGLAGGISMHVLHGFPYYGPYFNTSWPGFAVFSYLYTEMWTPRQPMWRHLNDTMDYIARNQFTLQIGTPQVDLAIIEYQPRFDETNSYDMSILERLGYTYDYLSPGNLKLRDATAADGLFAPNGPAYQAIVFLNQTKTTVEAAQKVKGFASAGVPIIFVENSNFTSIGQKEGEAFKVRELMSNIISEGLPSVMTVPTFADIEGALNRSRVAPRTTFARNSTSGNLWSTFRRKVDSTDLVWIFNDGSARETVSVTFARTGSKIPYVLDAWSGDISPVLEYDVVSSTIVIPVTLSAGETSIYAFVTKETYSATTDIFPRVPDTIVIRSEGVKGVTSTNTEGRIVLVAMIPKGQAQMTLSSGQEVHHIADVPNNTSLHSWNITIESWRGAGDYENSGETAIDSYEYTDVDLAAWKDLDPDVLSHVSGIGEYRSTFSTPRTTQNMTLGALLHLGELNDSARIWLNEELLAPVSAVRGDVLIDLTKSLAKPGAINFIQIETASTLYNSLQGNPGAFYTASVTALLANAPYFEANGPKPYGLIGPVWIEWVELFMI